MNKLIDTAFYFIAGHGRGWAFSSRDLLGRYSRQQVDSLLSELVKLDKIRRVARGMYDYPGYSELLQQKLSPDMDQVARAYARKFNWRIQISGETALNLLGLSTQVPATCTYLSDGPTRRYKVQGSTLEFTKSSLKNMGFKQRESSLVVQALKTLGKENISDAVLDKIRVQVDLAQREKILKDTRSTTAWIYEAIKQVYRGSEIHE